MILPTEFRLAGAPVCLYNLPPSLFSLRRQIDMKPKLVSHDWKALGAILAWVFATSGCSPEAQRYIRFPNFTHPGPAAAQRADAIYHDPYPLNDVGPEVVGGRPLAYQQSLNEVDRARLERPGKMLRPVPVPGSAVAAPPVTSSPFPVAPVQPAVPLTTTPPPIVTSPAPVAPAPATYGAPVAPIVTTPANSNSFPPQQRAPY